MDYWPRLKLTVHDDDEAFFAVVRTSGGGAWLFSSKGERSFWDPDYCDGDWLVFGSETRGIGEVILAAYPGRALRIPQAPDERCLNLATAAGIGLYHALRVVVAPQKPTPATVG
jgi:tRNA (cytidine/uridine-2'-O-)-methyltransferase